MPTPLRRATRKASKFLLRIEPVTILLAYFAIAGMAVSAWFWPPTSASYLAKVDSIIEAVLLSVGSILLIVGHLWKKDILELLGLIFSIAGTYVFLYILGNLLIVVGYTPIIQMVFAVMALMGFLFSKFFKVQDDVFNLRLKPPAYLINSIYK